MARCLDARLASLIVRARPKEEKKTKKEQKKGKIASFLYTKSMFIPNDTPLLRYGLERPVDIRI